MITLKTYTEGEVLTMIDYNIADKLYKEGKECFKNKKRE